MTDNAERIDPPSTSKASAKVKKITPIRGDVQPILPEQQSRTSRQTLPWAAIWFAAASLGWVVLFVAYTLGFYHWNSALIMQPETQGALAMETILPSSSCGSCSGWCAAPTAWK